MRAGVVQVNRLGIWSFPLCLKIAEKHTPVLPSPEAPVPHAVFAGNVSALMAEFRSVKLDVVDSAGRNPRDDRHYFGLVRSVVIGVQRMVAACRGEDEKEDAVGLLMAMSLLHGSETPVRLFCGEAALTPTCRLALRNYTRLATLVPPALVPPRPLEWLVRSMRASLKDYTAGATDVPIASSPAQVQDGEEFMQGDITVRACGQRRFTIGLCSLLCVCCGVFVLCRQGYLNASSGTCLMTPTAA